MLTDIMCEEVQDYRGHKGSCVRLQRKSVTVTQALLATAALKDCLFLAVLPIVAILNSETATTQHG